MTTTALNVSMPAGRHEVTVGASLVRALKARKPDGGQVKQNNKFDREFYSVRYNFKPESIDLSKPGNIETRKTKDGQSSVTVTRPSSQNENSAHYFKGTEQTARDVECVLIYDEETGTFTLEKIDSNISLHYDKKTAHAPRYTNSPAPAAPPRLPTSSSSHTQQVDSAPHEEEESEGEIPETKPETKPTSKPEPTPQAKPKPRPLASQQKSRTAPSPSSSTSQPASRYTLALPPKPAAVPRGKVKAPVIAHAPVTSTAAPSKGLNKRPAPPDEENLEIRKPVQPLLKKPKIVRPKKEDLPPPPPKPVSLSFPSTSNAVSFPPPLPTVPSTAPTSLLPAFPSSTAIAPATAAAPTAGASAVESDSDEEEWEDTPLPPVLAPPVIEMEEIDFAPPTRPSEPHMPFTPPIASAAPTENEGEEIDEDIFGDEIDQALQEPGEAEADGFDEDEDFLASAVSPVTERQPMSLNQYANTQDFGGDDDYSSSDDSDED